MSIAFVGAPANAHVALKLLEITVEQAMKRHVESTALFRLMPLAAAGACHVVGVAPPTPAENLRTRRRITKASES